MLYGLNHERFWSTFVDFVPPCYPFNFVLVLRSRATVFNGGNTGARRVLTSYLFRSTLSLRALRTLRCAYGYNAESSRQRHHQPAQQGSPITREQSTRPRASTRSDS